MERVFERGLPAMVKAGVSGKRFALASVMALLVATSRPAHTAEQPVLDCENKMVEDTYGTYVYDTLRLRPKPSLRLSVEETYGDYEYDESTGSSLSGISETEARSLTGLQVSIEPTRFQRGSTIVVDPHYEIHCFENFVGRSRFQTWDELNVFGSDREFIDTLSVFQRGDAGRKLRIAHFEIVGDDLWGHGSCLAFRTQSEELAARCEERPFCSAHLGVPLGYAKAGAKSCWSRTNHLINRRSAE